MVWWWWWSDSDTCIGYKTKINFNHVSLHVGWNVFLLPASKMLYLDLKEVYLYQFSSPTHLKGHSVLPARTIILNTSMLITNLVTLYVHWHLLWHLLWHLHYIYKLTERPVVLLNAIFCNITSNIFCVCFAFFNFQCMLVFKAMNSVHWIEEEQSANSLSTRAQVKSFGTSWKGTSLLLSFNLVFIAHEPHFHTWSLWTMIV